MLGILIMFSFWIALMIIIIAPLILTLAIGNFIANKLELDGIGYYLFLIIFYIIILTLFIVI